jgi:hypothetical protein
MEVEIGDVVGWFVDILHREDHEPIEIRAEVIAIHNGFLSLKSLTVQARGYNPFLSRHVNDVHKVKKA